jgi:imidazolonepropionase-like amidohydrolase
MAPIVRQTYLESRRQIDSDPGAKPWAEYFKKALAFERSFALAGGLLAAGADPTGLGGALPGLADQRNFELLVEAGFSTVEAIRIMTRNGAEVMGQQDQVGTVAPGLLADLVVIAGDPITTPSDIRKVVTVFKDGVGYDSAKLIASVKGTVGIR